MTRNCIMCHENFKLNDDSGYYILFKNQKVISWYNNICDICLIEYKIGKLYKIRHTGKFRNFVEFRLFIKMLKNQK